MILFIENEMTCYPLHEHNAILPAGPHMKAIDCLTDQHKANFDLTYISGITFQEVTHPKMTSHQSDLTTQFLTNRLF